MFREEIMDYAMISGDDIDELTIQTFINFNYQKFTAMRLVTILCDTMSCFLGLGNTTPLTECQILVGEFQISINIRDQNLIAAFSSLTIYGFLTR